VTRSVCWFRERCDWVGVAASEGVFNRWVQLTSLSSLTPSSVLKVSLLILYYFIFHYKLLLLLITMKVSTCGALLILTYLCFKTLIYSWLPSY
jgi:hypothetical protein